MRSIIALIIIFLFSLINIFAQSKSSKSKSFVVVGFASPSMYYMSAIKYLYYTDGDVCREKFQDEFYDALNYNDDTTNSNSVKKLFVVNVHSVRLYESSHTENIHDGNGSGLSIPYISCNVEVEFTITYQPTNEVLERSKIYVHNSEDVTNSRTIWDYIFGTNKDRSVYHVRELSEEVFIILCNRAAHKTARKSKRIIRKTLKKM